ETFGAPLLDAEKNRELFEEQLRLLLTCFNEPSFHFKGKYYECPPPVDYRGYQVKDITMVPRPKHLPVEIWMPIASGKTIELMAQYGLKAMITLNGEKILDDVVRAYHAACHKHGRPKQLGEDMIWGAGVYLADSHAEAVRPPPPAPAPRAQRVAPVCLLRPPRAHGGARGPPAAPARPARAHAGARRRGGGEGWVLRHARRGDRRHQVGGGEISRAGELHDPLGRGARAQGVHRAAALVRQGRDAGVQRVAASRIFSARSR